METVGRPNISEILKSRASNNARNLYIPGFSSEEDFRLDHPDVSKNLDKLLDPNSKLNITRAQFANLAANHQHLQDIDFDPIQEREAYRARRIKEDTTLLAAYFPKKELTIEQDQQTEEAEEPIVLLKKFRLSTRAAALFGHLISDRNRIRPITTNPELIEQLEIMAHELQKADTIDLKKFYKRNRFLEVRNEELAPTLLTIFNAPESLYEEIINIQDNPSIQEVLRFLLSSENRSLLDITHRGLYRFISTRFHREWINDSTTNM